MSAANKRICSLVCLLLVAGLLLAAERADSCRRNRTELARATISNLIRLYPELVGELASSANSQASTLTNTNTSTVSTLATS